MIFFICSQDCESIESPDLNFDIFSSAFVSIFTITMSEDWQYVMYNAVLALDRSSSVIFVLVILIGNFVMLNLFLALLLSQMSSADMERLVLQQSIKIDYNSIYS